MEKHLHSQACSHHTGKQHPQSCKRSPNGTQRKKAGKTVSKRASLNLNNNSTSMPPLPTPRAYRAFGSCVSRRDILRQRCREKRFPIPGCVSRAQLFTGGILITSQHMRELVLLYRGRSVASRKESRGKKIVSPYISVHYLLHFCSLRNHGSGESTTTIGTFTSDCSVLAGDEEEEEEAVPFC